MKMVNMVLSAASREKYPEAVALADQPQYPYGLCLHLDNETCEKLGLKELPAIETMMTLKARVMVKRRSESEDIQSGENRSMDLQIVEMGLGPDEKKTDTAKTIYGE